MIESGILEGEAYFNVLQVIESGILEGDQISKDERARQEVRFY